MSLIAAPVEIKPPSTKERPIKPPETGLSLYTRLQDDKKRIADLASGVSGGFNNLKKENPDINLKPEDRVLQLLQGELATLNTVTTSSLNIELERRKIYDDPSLDPTIITIETNILQRTNTDPILNSSADLYRGESGIARWNRARGHAEMTEWDNFVRQYPEKAKVYAEKGHIQIRKALEGQESLKKYRAVKAEAEKHRTPTLDDDLTFRAFVDHPQTGLNARIWQGVSRENSLSAKEYDERADRIRAKMEAEFAVQFPDIADKYDLTIPSGGVDISADNIEILPDATPPTELGDVKTRAQKTDDTQPEKQIPSELTPKITIVKEGPRFSKIIADEVNRENRIASTVVGDETDWKRIRRDFTEREGLTNLQVFIDKTIETAGNHGDEDIMRTAVALKENLAYIGEPELHEALKGIAAHVIELAKANQHIYICPVGLRSERYIALRIMEELDIVTEKTPELKQLLHFSESSKTIAKACKDNLYNCSVIVPDDFAVSGVRIRGFAGQMFRNLVEEGIPPEKAASIIKATLVAMPVRDQYDKESYSLSTEISGGGRSDKYPLEVYAYYGVKEYRDKNGKWYVHPGISLSASHCSVDYGFETEIERFHKYLHDQGVKIDMPLLGHINRPYEFREESGSRKYQNPELQARWGKITQKYSQ